MIILLYLLFFIPAQALAVQSPRNFSDFVKIITDLIGLLVIIVFVLTMLVFFWGLIKNLILKSAEPDKLRAGKSTLLWGITALVVMSALWGILALLQRTFFG